MRCGCFEVNYRPAQMWTIVVCSDVDVFKHLFDTVENVNKWFSIIICASFSLSKKTIILGIFFQMEKLLVSHKQAIVNFKLYSAHFPNCTCMNVGVCKNVCAWVAFYVKHVLQYMNRHAENTWRKSSISISDIKYNITDLVCYTNSHWFFNHECQHIFGKQTGYIHFLYFSLPKTVTWTTKNYASLNQKHNTE